MAANDPQFHVDDYVYFSPQKDMRYKEVPSERFVVVAVMPRDQSGNRQYRIRPASSGPLRMVSELELRR